MDRLRKLGLPNTVNVVFVVVGLLLGIAVFPFVVHLLRN